MYEIPARRLSRRKEPILHQRIQQVRTAINSGKTFGSRRELAEFLGIRSAQVGGNAGGNRFGRGTQLIRIGAGLTEFHGTNLGDAIKSICETNGRGFDPRNANHAAAASLLEVNGIIRREWGRGESNVLRVSGVTIINPKKARKCVEEGRFF